MATLQEALDSITVGMTVEQLKTLANSIDIDTSGSTLLLYSGGVGELDSLGQYQYGAGEIANVIADGANIKTIAHTDMDAFFSNIIFRNALNHAIAQDATYLGRDLNSVLYGKNADGVRIGDSFMF